MTLTLTVDWQTLALIVACLFLLTAGGLGVCGYAFPQGSRGQLVVGATTLGLMAIGAGLMLSPVFALIVESYG